MHESTGDILAFVDDDTELEHSWLGALAALFSHAPLASLPAIDGLVFLEWWLIGKRGPYSLLLSRLDLLTRRTDVARFVAASFRGKWEGLRIWWEEHRKIARTVA